jgi:hypothetical protein
MTIKIKTSKVQRHKQMFAQCIATNEINYLHSMLNVNARKWYQINHRKGEMNYKMLHPCHCLPTGGSLSTLIKPVSYFQKKPKAKQWYISITSF